MIEHRVEAGLAVVLEVLDVVDQLGRSGAGQGDDEQQERARQCDKES
ncbi:MAG: hypothetical protein GX621_07735 [Pirellulaceae bacterium]|nr:hypothetical protein [Pirellulaceae bacterium]